MALTALLGLALAACAPLPQRAGVPTRWLPSPNHDERRANFVIIHHTSNNSAEHSLRTLTDPQRAVSAHYLIGRDGTTWQLVDERSRAWHAGESYWAGHTDLNSASLGIELDNDGDESFAQPQIDALLGLLRDVTARHRIPVANVLGHGDVAPGRKVDPSRHFPWRVLAAHGFGLWCDPPYPQASLPEDLVEPGILLQALGYDVANPEAASAAFRRHFRQDDSSLLEPDDIALLQCLVRRKAGREIEAIPLPEHR